MIYTGEMIIGEYFKEEPAYACPRVKLSREAKTGKYIRLKRDLYEVDRSTPRVALAQAIFGPSYVSFDYALSHYGMIPEYAYNVTCATFNKRKDKVFDTDFCSFYYTDVPDDVFSIGIECKDIDGYSYYMATPEKALCDKLYTLSPVPNTKELMRLLTEDLRIEESELRNLDSDNVFRYSEAYRTTNIKKLCTLLRRIKN